MRPMPDLDCRAIEKNIFCRMQNNSMTLLKHNAVCIPLDFYCYAFFVQSMLNERIIGRQCLSLRPHILFPQLFDRVLHLSFDFVAITDEISDSDIQIFARI
jgi:hypothetical protein